MVTETRFSTGVRGLDGILGGGLIPKRAYLVRGGPGTGKSTLGAHFAAAGAALGEPTLIITLEESEEQLAADARSMGIDLGAVEFLDASESATSFTEEQTYDLFLPAEVERAPITKRIIESIERLRPQRVIIDSMSRFRMLATNAAVFRKQAVSLLHYLLDKGATVLMVSEALTETYDYDLCFMADGLITLESTDVGRFVRVDKVRGSAFAHGRHALRLGSGGMEVFPRLIPGDHVRVFEPTALPSGIETLDAMLEGGIEHGLVTMISGPSGVGKTTLAMQFVLSAVQRGEKVAVFSFEEPTAMLLRRCRQVGMDIDPFLVDGTLVVHEIEPLRLSSDELASLLVTEFERDSRSVIVVDSIAAYKLALRGDDLVERLHAVCRFMRNMGATVVLVNEISALGQGLKFTDAGISHLADNLLYLTYFERLEQDGLHIGRTISVIKTRVSAHSEEVYELLITSDGLLDRGPVDARGFVEGSVRSGG